MTNKDLYSALSDVDPDMVLDAQPAPKRSRPVWAKAVAIAACACLAVGVLAALPFIAKWAEPDTPIVPGETVTPEQTEQQTEVPTAGQVIGDPIQGTVFLYVPTEEDRLDTAIPDSFSPSYLYGIGTNTEKIIMDAYKDNCVISPFTGATLPYKHTEAYLKTTTLGEYGTYYSKYDRYETNSEIIDFVHGTNQIAFYSVDYNDDTSSPVMSEEEVKKIAETFILSLISEEAFEKFTYVDMEIDPLGRYSLLYRRYIEGYRTDETISIWVDRNGHVSAYNGYNVGKYDSMDIQISSSMLETADKLLRQEIASLNLKNLSCNDPKIITSTEGKLYLQMAIFYDGLYDVRCGDIVIINIE